MRDFNYFFLLESEKIVSHSKGYQALIKALEHGFEGLDKEIAKRLINSYLYLNERRECNERF
ncbi:MAG: hypothetical protein NC818_00215 [Candidatus Omnitrophica bacterium]|nr:hypothetical protein [Candidatus Omnitrophota bacterium]